MARPDDEVTGFGASPERADTGPTEHTPRPDESVEELKTEIAQAQGELQSTIAEIQERLSPAHIAEQARTTVRDATIGRVSHMAERAGETAERMAEQTRRVARRLPAPVRENPVPLALIGVGVAWLIGSSWSRRSSRDEWYDDDWDDTDTAGYSERERARAGYGSDYFGPTTGDERSTWSSASQKSAEIRQRLTRTTGDVQTRIARSMRENPLAYGVAALAAGALMGSLMPRTEVEDEYLGETRDSLLDSAREMAEDTVQKLAGNESPGQAAAGSSGFGGSASGVTGTSAGGGGIRTSSGRTAGTSGSTGAGTSTAATGMGGSQLDAGTSGTSQSGRGTSGSFGEAESAAGPASGTGTRKRRTSNTPDESGGMGSLG